MKLTKQTIKKLIKEELAQEGLFGLGKKEKDPLKDLNPGAQYAVADQQIIYGVMDFVERLVQGVGKEYAIELLQSEIDSLKGEG
jgi:hypothetical protein